jgi:hypothetical protein
MGLDASDAKFLLYTRSLGVDFSRTAMIGRQKLLLSPSEMQASLAQFGLFPGEAQVRSLFEESGGYAEPFLRYLGAREVAAFDYASYEGATHIHDMNEAIPPQFRGRYSVVLDSGSLEHIFNFPVALKNCMEMVEVGGHYVAVTPTNNFMGHGFYQFSPELFYSVFTEANGYALVRVMVREDTPDAPWFRVHSPITLGGRVTLVNATPTYLMVVAARVRDADIFRTTPQQSDYVTTWAAPGTAAASASEVTPPESSFILRGVRAVLPVPVKRWLRRQVTLARTTWATFDPPAYERIHLPPDDGTGARPRARTEADH